MCRFRKTQFKGNFFDGKIKMSQICIGLGNRFFRHPLRNRFTCFVFNNLTKIIRMELLGVGIILCLILESDLSFYQFGIVRFQRFFKLSDNLGTSISFFQW